MKGRQVVLGRVQGREFASLWTDGLIEDLLVKPSDGTPAPGAIFLARVGRSMKGQGSSFVEWPGGTGFLRQPRGVSAGQLIRVQVSGFAEPGKAVPVTTKVLFKSRYCIATPDAPGINISRSIKDEEERLRLRELIQDTTWPDDLGLILRSAALHADGPAVAEDLENTRALTQQVLGDSSDQPALLLDGPDPALLAWRDWPEVHPQDVHEGDDAVSRFDLDGILSDLREPRESLPAGAEMFIEPTRALVAVDVNTGRDSSFAAALKANIAAARALPRALRLRGLGGQIVVDFAPMAKKDRRQFETVLRGAFRSDPVDTALVGWTPLGNYELQRKRERQPLSETMK